MRVFAVSDLHTDFRENWFVLEQIDHQHTQDVLIVAGDIAHRIGTIEVTLDFLRSRFAAVFYVPGNHELWVRGDATDSLQKFERILEVCSRLDVLTYPAAVGEAWVVPLFSWYDPSFDPRVDGESDELAAWGDFRFCRWPDDVPHLSRHFLDKNEAHIKVYDAPVISFSHFLPRRDLLPERRHLRFKGLPAVAGSRAIDTQVRALDSSVHVFGHSHINLDVVIDGVRYVQNALGYPKERRNRGFHPRLVWDSASPE
jgi:predicted phosphodiesterase